MVDNDNISKLYNAMAKSGYDVADLGGSEDNFREAMKSPETRKAFYDWAAKNEKNGFRIGGYDEYESRLKAAYLQPQQPAAQRMYEDPSVYAAQNDYSQPTQAQRNYEERGEFAPIGQSTVKLNERDVPVLVGEDGEWRVPSPVMLDKDEEVLRHGNPSEEEKKELEQDYKSGVTRAVDTLDKSISEKLLAKRQEINSEYKAIPVTGVAGGMLGMSQADIAAQSDVELNTLQAAYNLVQDSRRQIERYRRSEDGFLKNTLRSAGEAAIDPRTWDFGLTDLKDTSALLMAVNKEERGEKLTEAENLLLDASVNNALIQAYYKAQSMGEVAGKSTVDMIPFMAQILLNPISGTGKAASSAASKAVAKYINKKIISKGLLANATKKVLPRATALAVGLPADMAAGVGMAVTTNAMRTAADANRRQLSGEKAGEAWKDAILSQGIEFASENTGRFFSPMFNGVKKVVGAGVAKLAPKSVVNLAKDISKKGYSRQIKEFFRSTQWDGFLEENAEEIAGGLMNAGLVKDVTVDDVFSKDNLFETAVGLSVAGVLFPTIGTVNYGVEKVKQRKRVAAAEAEAERIFGERWANFSNAIDAAESDEELRKNIAEVYHRENAQKASPEEIKALYSYVSPLFAYRAIRDMSPNSVADMLADDVYSTAYAQDISPKLANESYKAWENAGKEVTAILGLKDQSVEDWLGGRTVEDAAQGNQKLLDALTAYETAKADFEGRRDRYQQDLQRAYSESDKAIDSKANNGIVYTTQLDGEPVNITGGNVVLNDNGTVDYENSSAGLYLTMPDGSVRVIASENIPGEVLAESAEELKAAERAKIDNKWKVEFDAVEMAEVPQTSTVTIAGAQPTQTAQPVAATANNQPQYVINDEVVLYDAEGNPINGTIAEYNEADDTFVLDVDRPINGKYAPQLTRAELESMMQQPSVSNEQEATEAIPEMGIPTSAMERIPKDEQGNPIYEQVDNDTAWDAIVEQTEGDVEMAQTVADGMVADKEAALKKLEKAKSKGGATIAEKIAAEKERKAAIEAAKAELAKWQEIAGVAASRKAAHDINEESKTETVATEEVKPTENIAPVEEVQPAEVSVPELEMKTENGNENLRPITAPAEVADVETADEFVAGLLGGIKITPESFRNETGLKTAEQRSLIGIIAGEGKGGVSVERASEIIAESYGEELAARGFHGDQQEIRDMLIDILSSGNPRSYVKRNKERRAAQWVEQATAEADAWAQSYGFASYDDMLAYEEQLVPSIKERFKDFDEQTYYNILAENYIEYDTTRESERVSNGSEVLQGERSVPSPRTEDSGERNERGEVRYDVQGSDKNAVQEQEVAASSLLDVVRVLYSKGKEVASKLFQRSFFDIAQTPKFMQELGLRGDKFTIKYGVISRHIGKDGSHTLTERDWEQLPQALQNPFAISKIVDKKDSYRIYTTLKTESGEYVVVGADVKNAGREIEVNAISTVFGRRNNANLPTNEEVVYTSKEITPEQSSLLERPNFAQYPTEQELSKDKDTAISETTNEIEEKNVEWRDMSAQERMDVAAKSPLTVEEINNSSVDAVNKANAVAFVNGTNNFITQLSYLKVYEDVRNRPSNSPSDNRGEDNTQLAETNDRGSADGRAGGENGDDSLQDGAERSGEDRSVADGAESSTREPDSVSGETRDSGVRGEESSMDGVSADSGYSRGGGKSRSNGGDGRRRGREKSGGDIAVDADAELSAAIEQFKETLAEFSRAGRDTLNLNIAGLNSKQLEVLPKLIADGTKIGYILVKKGVRQITAWAKSIKSYIGEPLTNAGLSDVEVDAFIKELWNSNFPIGEEVHSIAEWASIIGIEETKKAIKSTLADKKAAQDAAESINVKVADAENIAETLPFLLPQQQEDVLKAETQFFDESHNDREHAFGKGYMFTNGTGTGKTYTGLGIVKRFIKQGKGRILIITPSQQKVTDWIADAKNLNISLRSLDDFASQNGTTATQTAGEGAVITTYANFRENAALLEGMFDLVVYDESHRLLENKAGTETRGAQQHYMITNRDEDAAFMRLREINSVNKKLKEAQDKFIEVLQEEREKKIQKNIPSIHTPLSEEYKRDFPKLYKAKQNFDKATVEWGKEELKLREQAKKDATVTKVVFLSATPFNTRDNLEYAERYIFMYPEEDKETIGSYKHQSPKTRFYLEYFGGAYKFRYGRLENAPQNADVIARQEVAFSDYLQNTLNTMSGRVIDSEFDYSRDFPTVSLEMGERINSAIGSISEVEELRPLWSARNKVWGNYNYSSALFETMKVSAMVPRLKEHLKKGRKIVIFHRRTESKEPIMPPFSLMMGVAQRELKETQNEEERKKLASAIRKFKKDYADLFEWEQTLNYAMPREQLAEAFGKENVLFFSGKESAKVKNEAVRQFNDDNSGKNIIVIQEASGKEGISLHDRTGKHQRVVITLALPQSPITALQIEGRIYRIGNKSNAIFEYPILGLNSEMVLFGQNFNSSVSTTENLALGSKARNLRDSFARGIEERSGNISVDIQGVGGKEADAGTLRESDPYDNAVLDYYTNQKITAKRDNREGVDYYPTPEPLGFMMNMWGRVKEGDEILEPSAGHGAIARYAPVENALTAIEPSQSLFARLQIKAGGVAGRSFVNDIFENYNIVNKHDVVLMNPPFGVQGKLAAEHVAKAYKHLNEGGRIVAIVPEGKAQDRIGKWLDEQKDAVVVGEVLLPDVTFVQAGTSIRCRVLVIDKISNEAKRNNAAAQKVTHNLDYVNTVEDFFEALRGIGMPDRTIDTQLIMEKKARRYASDLRSIKGVKEVYVNPDTIVVRTKGWRSFQIVWGDLSGDALKRSLAQQYSNFAKRIPHSDETSQEIMMESQAIICKLANMTEDEMERFITGPVNEDDTLYRTSQEIEAEYPNWLEGTTTESGKHSTQVEGTRKTYGKVGTWIEDNLGKNVSILDASSGMGYGTADLRERGFNIEDVEPYQSEERKRNNPATYSSYDDINKEYDFIISNAVLNVIPDDWRADVLHNMAEKLKAGGKMFINTRKAGEEKFIKDKIELDSPQEVLVKRNGKIASYQRFFTPQELKEWVESELGSGYTVAIANERNSGTKGLAAVVVTKNNESPANGKTSELGQPISNHKGMANAPIANVTAKVLKNAERANRLDKIISSIEKNSGMGAHEFLHEVVNAILLSDNVSTDESRYAKLGGGVTLRIADHYANASNFKEHKDLKNNYGLVIKLSNKRFKSDDAVDYLEYVYFPDKLTKERQIEIAEGLKAFMQTGRYELLPNPDKVNLSGKFKDDYSRSGYGVYTDDEVSMENDVVSKALGKPRGTSKQRREFAERERQRIVARVESLAKKLHLDNVEVVTDSNLLDGKKRTAKGFYSKSTGKITVVIPNHSSVADVENTLLHEAVAHYGLRQLFGKNFDTFLDNVYNSADVSIRREIANLAAKNGWDFRKATEEYLASLAENTNFDNAMRQSWWGKIKKLFLDMLHKIGFEGFDHVVLTDNELRYILWRSYENLKEPGRYRSILGEVADVAKQYELKVGNYAEGNEIPSTAADIKENSVSLANNLNTKENVNIRNEVQNPGRAKKILLGVRRAYDRAGRPSYEANERVARSIREANAERQILAYNPLLRETLDLLRRQTDNEIYNDMLPAMEMLRDRARNEQEREDAESIINLIKRFRNRNERGTIIRNLTGANLGEEIPFSKINELFELYNSDEDIAELYKRVKPFAEELGLVFKFDNLKDDDKGGAYTPALNTITFNAHMLYAPYVSQQRKASTIVHEIIHAVTVYAITAKKNNVKLSPKLEKAAQAINDIYDNVVKGNPALVHDVYDANTEEMVPVADYGTLSVLEMVAELANPEFANKLKQLEYDGRSVWQKIWDAIKSIFVGENEPQSVYEQLSEAFDTLVENFDREAFERSKEDGYKFYNIIQGVTNQNENDDVLFRSGGSLRKEYDKKVRIPNKSGSVKPWENVPRRLKEAYQDSMIALKTLQDLISQETGNPINSHENAYMAENRMSSENKAQAEVYERDFYKPLSEAVQALVKAGSSYEDLKAYIIAKHGLERNEYMRNEAIKNGDKHADKRDFSGLTALTGMDNAADAEAKAKQMVDAYEKAYNTAELWKKINAATKETLRKSYDSGLMDKATYEKVRDMYDFYVPLRGWNCEVAANEYEYLTSNSLMLSPALKTAQGRTSLADDPLATIGFMAESSIVQGNRNRMKQKFLNFILNNPTELVSVSEQWYVLDNATGQWKAENPDIPEDATGDEVAAIVEQFEQYMMTLGSKATKKRGGLNLSMNITKREGQEHVVRVKRNGKEYCLYINGSPRAAQAINGLTNPDANDSSLYKAVMFVKNLMASLFTSKNPAFVIFNLSRDVVWAGTAVAIKENAAYMARYTENITEALLKAQLPRLLVKFKNGTLDKNNEIERYFDEFIRNGGETGYTQLHTVEDYKRNIKRFVKEAQGKGSIAKKAWNGFFDGIEFLNRNAEDTTRFMVYMTSRQMGRDVARSIYDAKEITVNFNKKGSGGLGASVMNFCYIFFNATIQGLANFGRLMANHPVKATMALSTFTMAGFFVPMLNMAVQAMLGGGDDDNDYWDLPEWVRRSNIVLYIPWSENGYVTIPLPHELKPFYGMGEIAYSCLAGKENVEDGLRKAAAGFSALLPIDLTGNGGNIAVNLTPTPGQPIAQIIANVDYFGKPIYKRHEWNERDPEWTKAYKGTTTWLVDGTRWLNEISGGDNVKSGWLDINPAIIEHLFEAYTGGAGKTFNKSVKTLEMMWNEDMREWRNVPVVSGLYQKAEERTSGSQVNREYYKAVGEMEDIQHLISGYKREAKMGYVEYAEKLSELLNSEAFERYSIVKGYNNAIKKAQQALKFNHDVSDREKIETAIMDLKVKMLEELKNR